MKKYSILFLVSSLILVVINSCSSLPEEIDQFNGVQIDETANYISLESTTIASSKTGLLFYPGGLVDPHAYIPTLQALAVEGYPVIIVKVSANLAIASANKAASCKANFPAVEQWVLSGHSLGGAVACIDIYNNPSTYVGAILMASYSSGNASLADWNGTVLSLFGELDGLAPPSQIQENSALLPVGTTVTSLANMPISSTQGQTIYHQIDGGNHAQFGSYGAQKDDGEATITRAMQQTEIVNYIRAFFNANDW